MAINLKAVIAKRITDSKPLGAIVLGPSGAGKSYLFGTFGVPTLYVHTTGENHGPASARTRGGDNILPVCIDLDDEGKKRAPNEAFAYLIELLGDIDQLKDNGIGAVVIDSATELEVLVNQTDRWKAYCRTAKGEHDKWKETSATNLMFRDVLVKLLDIQRAGIHFATSCALDVKALGDNGEIMEAAPRLTTYSVAESTIQVMPDVFMVGAMTNASGEAVHRIQFGGNMSKVSKDTKGLVKKLVNFRPRLTGLSAEELPDHCEANLKKLVEFRDGVIASRNNK